MDLIDFHACVGTIPSPRRQKSYGFFFSFLLVWFLFFIMWVLNIRSLSDPELCTRDDLADRSTPEEKKIKTGRFVRYAVLYL